MSNSEEASSKEPAVHKIRFKKEPIWLKCNFVGKYNGIKFRFVYYEYCNDDVDDVIKRFSFTWPGRIPDNKEFAEKGIQALFMKLKEGEDSSIKMTVSKEEVDMNDEDSIDEFVNKALSDEEMGKQVKQEIDETIQEGQ